MEGKSIWQDKIKEEGREGYFCYLLALELL